MSVCLLIFVYSLQIIVSECQYETFAACRMEWNVWPVSTLASVVIESDGFIRRGFSEILVENEAWLLSEIGRNYLLLHVRRDNVALIYQDFLYVSRI